MDREADLSEHPGSSNQASTKEVTVHLVRHGLVQHLYKRYGRLPGFGLADIGKEMAIFVRESLRAKWVENPNGKWHIFVSPPDRTQETIEPFRKYAHEENLDATFQDENRINEVLTRFEKFGAKHVSDLMGLSLRGQLHRFTKPGWWKETYDDVAQRSSSALIDPIDTANDGDTVVFVSHQMTILTLVRHLFGKKLWNLKDGMHSRLGSITTLKLRQSIDETGMRTLAAIPGSYSYNENPDLIAQAKLQERQWRNQYANPYFVYPATHYPHTPPCRDK